jgi:hypothetical protein
MKMKRCEECGKKLGILEGYRHPVLGNDSLLCSDCFDSVNESVVKWRDAHLPYVDFFKNNNSEKKFETNLKKVITSFVSAKRSVF